ncbi:GDSL-type esterase/lipase family protein [Desertivirga brevis]|uniref:GDSL-type esterase/lipase family protein n=1 Tax=Desertivirga brevis TaxID=2810310 RepID=UPI001A95960F|nr:GDSL-type esterase/lipase family protein [Pedobacter sp. SYSU D00873]
MRLIYVFCLLLSFFSVARSQSVSRWEKEISAFEKQDAEKTGRQKVIIFTGSSTIRRWSDINTYFPGKLILNRGFGGSHASDLLYFADRITGDNKIKQILIYEGDNDLAAGKTVERVVDDLKKIVKHYRYNYPRATISILSIKPSPARQKYLTQIKEVNKQMQIFMASGKRYQFIDVFNPLLKEDGNPKEEIFVPDGVHMDMEGYKLWAEAIRPYLE